MNIISVRRFSNVLRFVNYLTALNDCDKFEGRFHEIHPLELELKKENLGHVEGSFLELMISTKR